MTVVFPPLLLLLLLQRVIELDRARKHAAALLARGGVESGRRHHSWMIAAHAGFYGLFTADVLLRRPAPALGWLALFALAQVGRLWVLESLGASWTTRVIVLPGAPLVLRGPYRWLSHPNYLIVVTELVTLCLAFAAWVTLAYAVLSQALVLGARLRVEEAALRPGRARAGASCSAAPPGRATARARSSGSRTSWPSWP